MPLFSASHWHFTVNTGDAGEGKERGEPSLADGQRKESAVVDHSDVVIDVPGVN